MANYRDSYEPSGARVAATAASETARGVGIGLALTGALLIGTPIVAFWAGAPIIGAIATAVAIGAAIFAPVVFGIAGVAGAISGFKKGTEKIDNDYARAHEIQKAQSVLTSQEREMGRAEAYAEMNQPRSAFMAQAPVYVSTGECPHCKVNSMNYQGQAVALQHGIAS
ncbi:MAG: hypothetical protein U1E36_05755 [Rickettsiales bacterium]